MQKNTNVKKATGTRRGVTVFLHSDAASFLFEVMLSSNLSDQPTQTPAIQTIATLIRRAEADRGVVILRPEILATALYKFTLAWIDLQRARAHLLNGAITVSLRGVKGELIPQARIEVPSD